jgi:MFS transporter, DHA1 family, multidrug resistance protein
MTHQDRHHTGWQTVLILFFITSAVESMSMSHVFAFMPVYLQSMQVPHVETWVGILSAVTFVVGLPLVPLWGIWAQRYGGKLVIIRSAYVEMAVFLILGLSHSLFGVFVAMMLVGFQLGNTGIMLAAIRQAAPDERVGFAVSVFSVSSSVGMAGGPLMGGVITGLHLLNLHGLYVLDGILSCLTGSMLLVFYRQPTLPPDAHGADIEPRRESAWTAAWQSVRFTFSLPVTWTLFAIYAVLMMARQMITPYLPIAIERLPLHSVSTTVSIGGLMGLSAVVGALITVVAGRLGDKVGFVRILILAFVCSLPAVLLLGLSRDVSWFILALTVFSAGYSIGGAMVFALFSTRIPETHRSTALNLVYLPLYLGGIVGPAVASGLTRIGLFGPFLGAAVLFMFGIVITVATRKYTAGESPTPAQISITG